MGLERRNDWNERLALTGVRRKEKEHEELLNEPALYRLWRVRVTA